MKKALLFFVLLLTACQNTSTARRMDLENINRANLILTDAIVYQDKLYLKQKNGEDRFIFSITLEDLTKKRDNRINEQNILKLKLEDKAIEAELRMGRELKIINRRKWDRWLSKILRTAIDTMVPLDTKSGLLLSIGTEEMVVYRDGRKKLNYSPLEQKPNSIEIVDNITNQELNELLVNNVRQHKEIQKYVESNILIFQSSADMFNFNMGLMDFNNKNIYYFDYDYLYEFDKKNNVFFTSIYFVGSVLIKSHVIELIKNPFSSLYNMGWIFKTKVQKLHQDDKLKIYEEMPIIDPHQKPMDMDEFNKKLDKILQLKTVKGNFDLYIGGEEYFPSLIKSIQTAQKSIDIRLYIFDNDNYGTMVADMLKEVNNQKGIKIKVLLDSFANLTNAWSLPSLPFKEDFEQPLSIKLHLLDSSRIKVRTSANPWFTFDHVKMLIFDEKYIYTGGMNIGQEYRHSWNDLMVGLYGPIVKYLLLEFREAWARNSRMGDLALMGHKIKWHKERKRILNKKKNKEKLDAGDTNNNWIDLRILYTKPGNHDIYNAQMLAIENAKKYIYIENPYFGDVRIINALIEARKRGVDVRVIFPTTNDSGLMEKSNLYISNILLKNKIRVYYYPGMTHVKAGLFDDWASIGTANYDALSFDTNRELNIAFSDRTKIEELKTRLFERDFEISTELLEEIPEGWNYKSSFRMANAF